MKLVILGSNGRTGAQVVRLALERNAEVTALVRADTARPRIRHDRLKVIVGDPCDPAILSRAFRGQDAVISTLGGRSPTRHATSVYPRSAEAIVEAAWDTGLKRVVVTSSALLFPPRGWIDRALVAAVPNVVQSATRMEQTLWIANLDVTVARCGFLTNGPEESYRTLEDALPKNGRSVSRRSLAHFLVDRVFETWTGQHVVGVSGPEPG